MAALQAVAVLGLLGAGCGGAENSSSTAPLTKAQYLKQANQICTKGLEAKARAVKAGFESIPRNEFPNLSKQRLAMLGERALAPYQKTVDELAALSPPAKDKKAIERLLDEFEAAAAETEAKPILLAEGNPFGEAGEAAVKFGLKACHL